MNTQVWIPAGQEDLDWGKNRRHMDIIIIQSFIHNEIIPHVCGEKTVEVSSKVCGWVKNVLHGCKKPKEKKRSCNTEVCGERNWASAKGTPVRWLDYCQVCSPEGTEHIISRTTQTERPSHTNSPIPLFTTDCVQSSVKKPPSSVALCTKPCVKTPSRFYISTSGAHNCREAEVNVWGPEAIKVQKHICCYSPHTGCWLPSRVWAPTTNGAQPDGRNGTKYRKGDGQKKNKLKFL